MAGGGGVQEGLHIYWHGEKMLFWLYPWTSNCSTDKLFLSPLPGLACHCFDPQAQVLCVRCFPSLLELLSLTDTCGPKLATLRVSPRPEGPSMTTREFGHQ